MGMPGQSQGVQLPRNAVGKDDLAGYQHFSELKAPVFFTPRPPCSQCHLPPRSLVSEKHLIESKIQSPLLKLGAPISPWIHRTQLLHCALV